MPPPSDHPTITIGNIGVLLVNLGTPTAPTPKAVRAYLSEFLTDRRVIELPALLRHALVRLIIAPTRARRSAKLYASIWDRTRGGSPLALITADQSAALQNSFGTAVKITHAMRYGAPSIAEATDMLRAQGCDRILLAPLYPQYCAATTATGFDAFAAHLKTLRWQPAVRTLPPYHDHPLYIGALAASLESHLQALDFAPEVTLLSFHGMPKITLTKGDPYHCHCAKTARLLREHQGKTADQMPHSFQSRLGAQTWLQPYSVVKVAELARQGVKRLAIMAPGFAADNLETLEEINVELGEAFIHNGGTHFSAVPALNASAVSVALLKGLIANELAGWLK